MSHDDFFGSVDLVPYRWVRNEKGYIGQQYMKINYDKDGSVLSREILEPAGWLIPED